MVEPRRVGFYRGFYQPRRSDAPVQLEDWHARNVQRLKLERQRA